MASRVHSLAVTVPAGTPASAPQVTPWVTEDQYVESIRVLVPPGHNGQTGIKVVKGDVQILPFGGTNWIIANNTEILFPVNQAMATSDVTVQTYNTGFFPHTFFLYITINDVPVPVSTAGPTESGTADLPVASSAPDPLSPDAILGAGTAAALADGTLTADDVLPADIPASVTAPGG